LCISMKKIKPTRTARQKLFCVITGDVIGSTLVPVAERKRMKKAMQQLGEMLAQAGFKVNTQEIFRGDSFQLVLSETSKALSAALLIRAWMRSVDMGESSPLDVRLGIGIGPIEFKAKSQNESDGTAYRHAAKALDQTVKQNLANIWMTTGIADLDEILNSISIALETMITRWTVAQAKSMRWSLQGMVHQDIANKLKVTQSTITRSLQSADDRAIQYLNTYSQKLISKYIVESK